MTQRTLAIFCVLFVASSLRFTFAEETTRRASVDSGSFGLVLDKAKELNLTDDQKKQLEEIKADYVARHDAMDRDPQLKEIAAKMRTAREARDEAQMTELQKGLRERQTALLGGDKPLGNPMTVLTDEQREKFRGLLEKSRVTSMIERMRSNAAMTAKIIENANEVDLSVEQRALITTYQSLKEKMEGDADLKTLFNQIREATAVYDEVKIAGVVEKITARKVELGIPKDLKAPIDILSEEQQKKLIDSMMGRNAANGGDADRRAEAAKRERETKRDGDVKRDGEVRREAERKAEPRKDDGERKRDGDVKKDPAKEDLQFVKKVKPNNDE